MTITTPERGAGNGSRWVGRRPTRSRVGGAVLLALLAGGLLQTPVRAAFPLVVDGNAAPIVIAPGAPEAVREAVGDLARYIEAATGARPEVREVARAGGDLGGAPGVLVGEITGITIDPDEAGFDGYRIRVTDRRLLLAGAGAQGTANAVYDLLDTALGVRFLVPGDEGVVVPDLREARIPVSDRLERPAFALRRVRYGDEVVERYSEKQREELERFVRRNRGGGIPAVTSSHFRRIVDPDVHFAEHPEYFAEVYGQRLARGQLCTSNHHVVQLAADYWIDVFDRDPDLQVGSLSQNEGGLHCTCEQCLRVGEDAGARLVEFMNDVARRVSRVHPRRLLAFQASGPLASPPTVPLHANLIPTVVRYQVCQAHAIDDLACRSNAAFRKNLDGWLGLSRQMLVRDYTCWWSAPDLATGVLAGNLRAYRRRGALGVSREYLRRGFGADLMQYVDLHLLWNPDDDPNRLIDNFVNGRYGSAAWGMRQVIQTLRSRLEGVDPRVIVDGSDAEIFKVYDTTLLTESVARLERLARDTPGAQGERVAHEAEMLQATLDVHRISELTRRYLVTGRDEDLERLRSAMTTAARSFRRLETRGLGSSFGVRLERLRQRIEGPGIRGPIAGEFEYEDDMTHGGFSRRDADRIDGFYPGQYGLALLPGRTGRISYTFEAASGHRFRRVELDRLLLRGSTTRIEVKVGGRVRLYSASESVDMDRIHDLSPLVAGSDRFTLTFQVGNKADRPRLCLDHWRIRVTTETPAEGPTSKAE